MKNLAWGGLLTFFFVTIMLTAAGQSPEQPKLLQHAYENESVEELFQFFDNWSEEIKSNENKDDSPYLRETYQVFKAFFQPLRSEYRGALYYQDKPYFIVQGYLWKISEAEEIITPDEMDSFLTVRIRQHYHKEKELQEEMICGLQKNPIRPMYDKGEVWPPYAIIPTITLDSAIEFRPSVHFADKKIVYLTSGYEALLDTFMRKSYGHLVESNISFVPSNFQNEARMDFINNAAKIFYGHWGGYWQYETYPRANQIIFNPDMTRAVVYFRFKYEGGEVILEKKEGEWVILDIKYTWME